METSKLKKFAQYARRTLMAQVSGQLALVLAKDSPARRESPQAVAALEKQISASNQGQVIENTAYLWFNRFCALRFMDANAYNKIQVVSPAAGQFQPEVLAEAKGGYLNDAIIKAERRELITRLLNGTAPSRDPQGEAYRLLIVAVCNDYHRLMPYLFAKIDDFSELLMPEDLLSESSILAYTREAMTPEACKSVEVIGWLYQFYISEKKDEVFEGLKKNKKITPANIPAATQLFTPHWIVRYLVENSLGRLWMLNHPESRIIEQMDYYIKPETAETEFLKIASPKELKICDPACGSGHMLTYAYDLLYAIYLDANYDATEIPELILTHNLYGIEIDERAAELAAFALSMKALKGDPRGESHNRRQFFQNPIKPNICRLEAVSFQENELDEYIGFIGQDLFTVDLRETLKQFEDTNIFGSLIRPKLKNVEDVFEILKAKNVQGQIFLTGVHEKVLRVLQQTEYLRPKYQVVIANPPYMGVKGMNPTLAAWVQKNYPNSKSDLFATFMERGLDFTSCYGYSAMITMQSWMFLSSYEKLRKVILNNYHINNLIQIGYNSFPELNSKIVQAAAFVLQNSQSSAGGIFYNLNDAPQAANKEKAFKDKLNKPNAFHIATAEDFKKIPGMPLAYWFTQKGYDVFKEFPLIGDISDVKTGMTTSNNSLFLRFWYEVSHNKVEFKYKQSNIALKSDSKWFPYNKGGGFRRWYGFNESVINWKNNGYDIKHNTDEKGKCRASVRAENFYFKPSVTYSAVTSSKFSSRLSDKGFLFDSGGSSIFGNDNNKLIQGILSSKIPEYYLAAFNATLNFQPGDIARLPVANQSNIRKIINKNVSSLRNISKHDWDSYENSWNFRTIPLLMKKNISSGELAVCYSILIKNRANLVQKTLALEVTNNRIFIDAYGMQSELTPEISLKEITLTCNPHYRYGGNKTDTELEAQLQADTMAEFLSYSVGCMFGRYSLDKPGLILANQGDTLQNYLDQVPKPSFMPDKENAIPMIDFDGDWFEDDISERFKQFLRITFGSEHYEANLHFIEESLGKDVRKYFIKYFYSDHVKRYKKRPIYWLFSSAKGTFNTLIYLHRYEPDTASIVLNEYLREFRIKLTSRKEALEQVSLLPDEKENQREKTKALKDISKIEQALTELDGYEHDILYPLAAKKLPLDLDDGVKVNYPRLGKALKKVVGLS